MKYEIREDTTASVLKMIYDPLGRFLQDVRLKTERERFLTMQVLSNSSEVFM